MKQILNQTFTRYAMYGFAAAFAWTICVVVIDQIILPHQQWSLPVISRGSTITV